MFLAFVVKMVTNSTEQRVFILMGLNQIVGFGNTKSKPAQRNSSPPARSTFRYAQPAAGIGVPVFLGGNVKCESCGGHLEENGMVCDLNKTEHCHTLLTIPRTIKCSFPRAGNLEPLPAQFCAMSPSSDIHHCDYVLGSFLNEFVHLHPQSKRRSEKKEICGAENTGIDVSRWTV
jgi:hypothetical protein